MMNYFKSLVISVINASRPGAFTVDTDQRTVIVGRTTFRVFTHAIVASERGFPDTTWKYEDGKVFEQIENFIRKTQ